MIRRWCLIPVLSLFPAACPLQAEVTVTRGTNQMVLGNGLLRAVINADRGDWTLEEEGLRLVTKGYWSQVGRRNDGKDVAGLGKPGESALIAVDPAQNGGRQAAVSLSFQPGGDKGGLPCAVELRYDLLEGDSTIYVSAVWRHGPGMEGFSIAEARHCLKLNPQVFDYLAVDENRHGIMPSGADWDQGTPLNVKEARRLTTGPFAGKVEHKYDYSAPIAETPAWGWASTARKLGIWMINPSAEYLSGGPMKMELTGHLDFPKGAAVPVLLNMWHGSHYGGSSLVVGKDEGWTKTIGPFAVHTNAGAEPEKLWRQAQARAATEKTAWPFDWLKGQDFPGAAQRGRVHGHFAVSGSEEVRGKIRIGLTPAAYSVPRRGGTETVDWQRDSRNYQFWTTADADGQFAIPSIRPGEYTLTALVEGVPGEFSHGGIRVPAGTDQDLGKVVWQLPKTGRKLWQIGIADRSAGEFRHGDHYWHWGLYYQYAREFPNDVDYTIGHSDWSKDWNYAQCSRCEEGQRAVQPADWKIHFTLETVPAKGTVLRLGICGNRSPQGVLVSANDQPCGGTGPMPDTAVMHRDGIRGCWLERRVEIPASALKVGENTFSLKVPAKSWTDSVMYDYVRLEEL